MLKSVDITNNYFYSYIRNAAYSTAYIGADEEGGRWFTDSYMMTRLMKRHHKTMGFGDEWPSGKIGRIDKGTTVPAGAVVDTKNRLFIDTEHGDKVDEVIRSVKKDHITNAATPLQQLLPVKMHGRQLAVEGARGAKNTPLLIFMRESAKEGPIEDDKNHVLVSAAILEAVLFGLDGNTENVKLTMSAAGQGNGSILAELDGVVFGMLMPIRRM